MSANAIRRGFLDVHTPPAALQEIQMPIDEQRAFLLATIREMQDERAVLYDRLGRPNKKNMTHYMNTKPKKRAAIRSGRTQQHRDTDRYLQLGQRIQEMCAMLGDIKRNAIGGKQ